MAPEGDSDLHSREGHWHSILRSWAISLKATEEIGVFFMYRGPVHLSHNSTDRACSVESTSGAYQGHFRIVTLYCPRQMRQVRCASGRAFGKFAASGEMHSTTRQATRPSCKWSGVHCHVQWKQALLQMPPYSPFNRQNAVTLKFIGKFVSKVGWFEKLRWRRGCPGSR